MKEPTASYYSHSYKAFRHVETLFIQGVLFLFDQARYWLALIRQPIASLAE